MSEEGKIVHHHHHEPAQHHHGDSDQSPPPVVPQYGTFAGIPHSTAPVVSEEGKIVHHHHHEPGQHHHGDSDQSPPPPPPPPVVPQYGTFSGIPHSRAPVVGFPQPAPPPGAMDPPPDYYARGYQAVPGYVVAEGTPVRGHHRLPCCGIGFGWFLFIIGFFLVGIPWYIGAIFLICRRHLDAREKPGYVACTIAAVLAIIAVIFGVSRING